MRVFIAVERAFANALFDSIMWGSGKGVNNRSDDCFGATIEFGMRVGVYHG